MNRTLRYASSMLAVVALGGATGWAQEPVVVPDRPQGYWQPGGYEARVGSPYYYSVPSRFASVGTSGAPAGQSPDCDCNAGRNAAGPRGVDGMLTVRNFPYQPLPADPYAYHFGPGFYRAREYGHYRFPYYNYRAPWYFPGHPVYNRDTNFAW